MSESRLPRAVAALSLAMVVLVGCGEGSVPKSDGKQASGAPLPVHLSLKINAQTPHLVGVFSPEAASLKTRKGEAGVLHYGPYTQLPPGAYRAAFHVRAAAASGRVGVVDVNVFQELKPETILGSGRIIATPDGQASIVTVDFDAKAGDRHEFRAFATGEGEVELLEINVLKR